MTQEQSDHQPSQGREPEEATTTQASDKPSPTPPGQAPEAAGGPATEYHPRYTPFWNNLITMAGLFVVVASLLLMLTFGLFSVVTPTANPYVDIVGFLVLPGILVFGLILIPVGILFRSWRLHRHDPTQRVAFRFPRVDLNDPVQRRAAKFVAAGTFVMLPIVAVTGYHGYHFTDSSGFCAEACHSVMHPQAITYEHSSHARVACAECHIGSGASWFVKAKLSGTRQVLAMLQDSFPRPIPPAISELRPARETCEQCHWPYKFFGAQLKEIVHFASDEHNTRSEIDMLLKIGGGDESLGRATGIHKHMALSGQIEYIATDERLQEIPWVKWTDSAGRELIYRSDGKPSSDPMPDGLVRQLDCMDCHNRPAHKFRSPQNAVDGFLNSGKISMTLPFIKREAVAALVREYPDVETAEAQIGAAIDDFYKLNMPEIWATRRASINQAIDNVRRIYRRCFFPSMKVDWRTYPDNIGHMISPGCFRCHDGSHINQRGEKLSHECNICHDFLNPIEVEGQHRILQQGDFVHPYELQGRHQQLRCDKCHTGGIAPVATCEGCHDLQQGFYGATLEGLAAFDVEPSSMFGSVDCESCHDLSEPVSVESVDALCMDCHDEEEYEGMLAGWLAKLAAGRTATEASINEVRQRLADMQMLDADHETRIWLAKSDAVMRFLTQAGDHHNPDAALNVYMALAREARNQAAVLDRGVTSSSPLPE